MFGCYFRLENNLLLPICIEVVYCCTEIIKNTYFLILFYFIYFLFHVYSSISLLAFLSPRSSFRDIVQKVDINGHIAKNVLFCRPMFTPTHKWPCVGAITVDNYSFWKDRLQNSYINRSLPQLPGNCTKTKEILK